MKKLREDRGKGASLDLRIEYQLGMSAPEGALIADMCRLLLTVRYTGLGAHINACSCDGCVRDLAYAPRAIETLQLAVRITPANHPSLGRCFLKLAKEHQRAFESDRDLSHIDHALSALSKTLQHTPSIHPDFTSHLEGLAEVYMLRFDLTEDDSDLDESISNRRRAVKATPEGNIELGCRHNSLGQSLYLRFQRSDNLKDLSSTIDALTKALEVSLNRHTSLQFLAHKLGRSLQSFVKRIDTSLRNAKSLPSQCSEDAADKAACGCYSLHLLSSLAFMLHLRFNRAGALSDLAAAISIQRLVVHLTPQGHPNYAVHLQDLGSSLQSRFQRHGDLCDIDEAISLFQTSTRGKHHPGCHTGQLENGRRCTTHSIASCFQDKYQATRDRSDIDEAVCALQRIVDRNSEDLAHPCVAAWLRGLGFSFGSRFLHTRDARDISEAISIQERLVQHSESLDLSKIDPKELVILSDMLDSRFVELGDPEDIDRAISLGRRAVQLSSQQGSNKLRAETLQSLAGLLISKLGGRTERCGISDSHHEIGPGEDASPDISYTFVLEHLNEAVALSRESVERTLSDDLDFSARLDNLAVCLHARFDHAGDPRDIHEAVENQVRAVELVPDHHAARKGTYTARLAELYHCWYASTSNDAYLAEMTDTYQLALLSKFQRPEEKLQAAIRFARHCVDVTQNMAGFDTAIDAIAMVVGLDQTITQRYSRIDSFSEMPLEAAAFACRSGRTDKALEWLEQGRCLVWSQLNYLRTPLEALREHDSALATEISDVSKRLEEAGSRRAPIEFHMPASTKLSLDEEVRDHAKLAVQWDELLIKARAIPSFESFLKPLTCSALINNLPPSGNVVIVTAHKNRCDAIALIAGLGEPLHIPLPDFSISRARQYKSIMDGKLCALGYQRQEVDMGESDGEEIANAERGIVRYQARDRNILYVLKGLWVEVVKPILDALAISVSFSVVSYILALTPT